MVQLGQVSLGDGTTKLCVPLMGATVEDILTNMKHIRHLPCHVVEWRLDTFHEVQQMEAVVGVLLMLKPMLGDKALLATFRTDAQGGEQAISWSYYFGLYEALLPTSLVDGIDVEYIGAQAEPALYEHLRTSAARHHVTIIMSDHDFHHTPRLQDGVDRLAAMYNLEPQVVKLACMPENTEDVLTLLRISNYMKVHYPQAVVITMSMGPLGVISRLCGSLFGNAMSFGAGTVASAPGQVDVSIMQGIMSIIDGNPLEDEHVGLH